MPQHRASWQTVNGYVRAATATVACAVPGGGLSPATISRDQGRSMLPVEKLSHRDAVHILAPLHTGAGGGPSTEQAETPAEEGVCPQLGQPGCSWP